MQFVVCITSTVQTRMPVTILVSPLDSSPVNLIISIFFVVIEGARFTRLN